MHRSRSRLHRRSARALRPAGDAVLDNPELRAVFLPVIRADFEAVETYSYLAGEPLPVPITALGGLDDPRATEDELREWRTLTRSSFAAPPLCG